MEKYIFSDDMDEISGFGDSYEQGCRAMVVAGVKWLDENNDVYLAFQQYCGVYGVIDAETVDAKALIAVMCKAVDNNSTGLMEHATINHVMFIKKHGWETYKQKMIARKKTGE